MIVLGVYIILFIIGCGFVVGLVILLVIKICVNFEIYKNLSDDMDINVGSIIEG